MIVVPQHNALVLKANNPEQILACIPQSKRFNHKGTELVYVPHDIDAVKILRNLGAKAPGPMDFYYEYPKAEGKYDPFIHQRTTAEFLTLHNKCAVLNAPRCVDADTEYLSPEGWKRIADYTGGMVAQYNQTTTQLEFVEPEQYHVTPCDVMIHFKTRSVNQMLSLGHRMLFRRSTGGEFVQSAQETYELLQRGKYKSHHGIPATFAAPDRVGLAMTDAQLRVMVAVIADGHFNPSRSHRVTLRLKKDRKIERLRGLLTSAEIPFAHRLDTSTTGAGFSVFSFDAPRREKDFSQWWGASADQLQLVADEVLHWDGNVTTGRDRFSTFIKETADFIQYAFSASGRVACLKENHRDRRGKHEVEYVVQVHQTASGTLRLAGGSSTQSGNAEVVSAPGGKMYCFTVPSTFLVFRRNGHVFVSGNTGKTNSCLWASDYLMGLNRVRKVLIVSPLSTLERVWGDAIFLTFFRRKALVLYGSAERRKKLLKQEADFYIINHDGFGIIADHITDDFDLVIYDEAAVLRNPSTRRFKQFHKFMQLRPNIKLWLLTGTPTPNEPTDAWSLCKLLDQPVPRYTLFRESVMMKVGQWSWKPRPDSEKTVQQVLQPSIRFSRDDCFDLPETIYETRQCELHPEQEKMYKRMLKELVTEIGRHQITAVNEAVKVQKLVQILLGVVYDTSGERAFVDCEPRVAVIREVIEECLEKVIVFVPFTGALDELAERLSKDFSVAIINGGVPKHARDEIFRQFALPTGPRVLVADARTMSHGLDLSSATTTIWAAPPNSNETYEQANARIMGPKQKHKTAIVHIEATPLERRMYQRLKDKQSLQGLLLDVIQQQEI